MAKISRRAVASSSSSSSSTSSESSSAATANNIAQVGKSARVSPSEVGTAKYGGDSINSGSATVLPDPLRGGGGNNAPHQFTTHSSRSVYATTTTTGFNEHTPYTAHHHPNFIDSDNSASPEPPYLPNKTSQAQILAAERERIRAEFFATYDVMTGVRIAATLGGFFGLMVFLIVWKSRSSSNETLKVLKDPKMAAVAAVCMQEEEDREIHEAMVATGMSIYPDEYEAIAYRRQRMLSLGNVSAPPMLNRGFRFSSVGGYSSLLEPPRRFSYSAVSGAGSLAGGRRKSGSESSRILSNYPMGSSFGNDDYFMETEDEMDANGDYLQSGGGVGDVVGGQRLEELGVLHKRTDSTKSKQGFLEVPLMGQDSRRSSAMTCCSTESSYLERRCSAFTLGLGLPPTLQRKLSTASRSSSTENWDYYYPDIQVIQPTPKPSPCPSERSSYEHLQRTPTAVTTIQTTATTATTTTSKTAKLNNPLNKAANGSSGGPPPTFVRKHSIAYYDPESAQAGRKQQIHSISADTVDVYPYNQAPLDSAYGLGNVSVGGGAATILKPIQSAPPVGGMHYGFHFSDSPTEELRLNVRRKIAVVELQRYPFSIDQPLQTPPPNSAGGGTASFENNNNSFPYTNSAAAIAAVAAAAAATANSSSISIDSTPVSIDKLNGSGSLGTISAKTLFNAERRAPLASLSSFKISSLEYQDSEMRSLDEDSVFVDSVADTDEDMQQLSSDSEEASLGAAAQDHAFSRTDTILVAPKATTSTARFAQQQQQQEQQHQHQNQQQERPLKYHYPIEKRYSLGASINTTTPMTSGPTASRGARRPLLQRHRTISASSSDRISLLGGVGQQLKEFPGSGTHTPTTMASSSQALPLETHFGTLICTSSPPTHPRRAQLLQQYSDPQSLPTTTPTTEDDTCSTLNTEVCTAVTGTDVAASSGGGGGGGGGSSTHTQHSSLNTVVSFGRASPLADVSGSSYQQRHQMSCSPTLPLAVAETINSSSGSSLSPIQQTKQQLPRSRLTDADPCASSISDSALTTRQPIICMPSSLKNLILRGSTSFADKTATATSTSTTSATPTTLFTVSRSVTNLSLLEARHIDDDNDDDDEEDEDIDAKSHCPSSVMLELPLIKLPTDEESSDSSSDDIERSRSNKSDESRDPSLPGSSRKWSKETLF